MVPFAAEPPPLRRAPRSPSFPASLVTLGKEVSAKSLTRKLSSVVWGVGEGGVK